jgi:hypothetical protein
MMRTDALVDELYPRDRWLRRTVQTNVTACGNKARDPNGKATQAKACQGRTELILTNFDPATRRRLKIA